LAFVAYSASTHAGAVYAAGTVAVRGDSTAQALRRVAPAYIPPGEVIVGHPRDGIVELPDVARTIRR